MNIVVLLEKEELDECVILLGLNPGMSVMPDFIQV